jgi:hypothetical protein
MEAPYAIIFIFACAYALLNLVFYYFGSLPPRNAVTRAKLIYVAGCYPSYVQCFMLLTLSITITSWNQETVLW